MLNSQTSVTPGTWAECVFRLLQTLCASGWQVIAWSNGSAFQNTPVSNPFPWSANNTGLTQSSDLNNNRSYFVVQQPPVGGRTDGGGVAAPYGGTRQIKVQRGTTSALWRVAYSFSGAYTNPNVTGSALVAPQPNTGTFFNDEVFIKGGGTDVAPTFTSAFLGTEGASRFNCFVDNGSLTGSLSGSTNLTGVLPNPYPYGWWMTTFTNGGGSNAQTAWMFDPMVSGSFPAQDLDPFVLYVDGQAANPLQGNQLGNFCAWNSGGPPACWYRKGPNPNAAVNNGGQFAATSAAFYNVRRANTNNNVIPLNLGVNAHTNADDFLPIMYIRPASRSAGLGGYKGISSLARWIPRSLSVGNVFSLYQSRDRITMGHVILPWDTSNPLV